MEKITMVQLLAYVPHGLKIKWDKSGDIWGISYGPTDYSDNLYALSTLEFTIERDHEPLGWKPILRPLSDLTNEIEHNGDKFIPAERIDWGCLETEYEWHGDNLYFYNIEDNSKDGSERGKAFAIIDNEGRFIEWHIMELLLSWHFDVFGLIERGLAIDSNTLTN